MLLISWIVRILVILFVVRLALRFVSGIGRPTATPRTSRTPATREGGHLVRDPNCGTYVPVGRALQSGTGDAAVYFCSDTCRQAWATRKAG